MGDKEQIRKYVTCPNCGRRLCKAIPGSEVELDCPKCEQSLLVNVDTEGSVIIKPMSKIPPVSTQQNWAKTAAHAAK